MKLYEYHKSDIKTDNTLVCLAGATEGAFRFYDSLNILKQNFNVILFNNPGVDGNVDDIFFTTDDLAEKFQTALDELNIGSYYLLGHSMGGFIAQKMAIAAPKRVKKLVIFGSTLGSYRSMDNFEYLRYEKSLSKIEDFSFTQEFQQSNPRYIEQYLREKKELYKLPRKSVFANFLCGAQHSIVGHSNEIVSPTLVIQGTEDLLAPAKLVIEFAQTLPNAHLLLIEGAGHNPFNENPSIMNDVVAFLLDIKEVGKKLEQHTLSAEEIAKDNDFRANIASLHFLDRVKNYFNFDAIGPTLEEYSANYYNKPTDLPVYPRHMEV
jgi:pimeloyl-ACP methyl ester carboxylesterase